MALRFTARGVVAAPETVQIRVDPDFGGRIAIGAPIPSRALTSAEVVGNARFFARPGPRERAVRRVVLSGVPLAWVGGTLASMVTELRSTGLSVVLHVSPAAVSGVVAVVPEDVQVALAAREPADLEAFADLPRGRSVQITVPLYEEVLARLPALLEACRRPSVGRVTLFWPYPAPGSPPPPAASMVVAALERVHHTLGLLPWGIKGIPLCAVQPLETRMKVRDRVGLSANRHYVDADHQRDRALLWRPDLVRLAKIDTCRFCKWDHRCDGVSDEWLRLGLTGGLTPVEDGPERG